jgi:hypothetical protein
MNALENLRMMLQTLSPSEIRMARKYVEYTYSGDYSTKVSQLLELLLQNIGYDYEQLEYRLTEKRPALNKLIERLTTKIGNALTSEFSMMSESSPIADTLKKLWEIQSKLFKARIFLRRGLTWHVSNLLNQAIELCKEVEDYSSIKQALTLQLQIKNTLNLVTDSDDIKNQIIHYSVCENLLIEVEVRLSHLLSEYTAISSDPDFVFWENELTFFENAYTKTRSVTIRYFQLQAKTTYHVLNCEYLKSSVEAFSMLKLVKENLVLNKKSFIGISHLFITQALIYSEQYTEAAIHLDFARQNFQLNSYNYCLCDEHGFYLYFFTKNYESAEKAIRGIIRNPNYTKAGYLDNKKEYLLSCCQFANNETSEAIRTVLKISDIQQDKSGWNFGIRFLKAMIFCNSKDDELLFSHLKSFERDISRTKKKTTIRERDILIYKLFREFSQHFSFIEVKRNKAVELELLASTLPQYRWLKHGHELIPIHEWFLLQAQEELKSKNRKSK